MNHIKTVVLLFLCLQVFTAKAQLPEANLIFKLDYDESFSIDVGETSSYEYQGGFLANDRYGLNDNSCVFEADKQHIVFEDVPCLEREVTISLWLKYESFQGERYPIIKLLNDDEFVLGETKHLGFEVHNNKTAISYYNEVGGRLVYDQDSITYDNEWHHLIGVVSDLSLIKLYIDNEYIGYQEFNDATLDGIDQIIIGGGYDNLFGHMNIDDIRIYNRALERCEIASLYYEKDTTVNCDIVEEIECSALVSTDDLDPVGVNVYPNPVTGDVLNIESYKNATYKIVNTVGQVVQSGEINDNRVPTRDLNTGIHFLFVDEVAYRIVVQ